MQLLATDDVSEQSLQKLLVSLRRTVDVVPHEGRFCFRSLEAPSWIRLFGEAHWWVQLFAGVAALYIAELVKEAGKETWKGRASIVARVGAAGSRLRALAAALFEFKAEASQRTQIVVGLPEPHEYFGVQLRLGSSSIDEMELELALFVHYVPAVKTILETNKAAGIKAATGYFLDIGPAGELRISWFDTETLQKRESVITLSGDAV